MTSLKYQWKSEGNRTISKNSSSKITLYRKINIQAKMRYAMLSYSVMSDSLGPHGL